MRFVPWLKRLLPLLPALCLAGAAAAGEPAPTLQACTEEWPPYNYTERGQLRGIATDTLRQLCSEAGVNCQIQSMPWARAYRTALSQANTLLYLTARRPDRESDFHWIGPLLPRSTWVYGRRGAEKLQERRQLAGLRFAVVRGEAAAQDLLAAGVPPGALLEQASNASALRMLLGGLVDAVVDTEIGMAWNLRQQQADAAEVQPLLRLSEEGAYYYALSKQSDPALATRLQAALERLRKKGVTEDIRRAYLSPLP
ncbi:transporter substrate-binding domain-containing protein [Roseateles sp. DAIF2]|uniref:substrate-binding periplasmic protein n=1 Tax=Roseateles sp. DAIF2 TaxID=2714952 RepID=UPI0018A2C770|nr:transporter substrate-binding domain-containing protein [Roseateles sp. DAIF2]QPF74533.1 transporter substrate-binding domain-containing protein [Roseateles sp. DAIF2]